MLLSVNFAEGQENVSPISSISKMFLDMEEVCIRNQNNNGSLNRDEELFLARKALKNKLNLISYGIEIELNVKPTRRDTPLQRFRRHLNAYEAVSSVSPRVDELVYSFISFVERNEAFARFTSYALERRTDYLRFIKRIKFNLRTDISTIRLLRSKEAVSQDLYDLYLYLITVQQGILNMAYYYRGYSITSSIHPSEDLKDAFDRWLEVYVVLLARVDVYYPSIVPDLPLSIRSKLEHLRNTHEYVQLMIACSDFIEEIKSVLILKKPLRNRVSATRQLISNWKMIPFISQRSLRLGFGEPSYRF